MTPQIRLHSDRGVATVRFSSRTHLNSFNEEFLSELATTLHATSAHPDTKVIILEGGASFSSGQDLKEVENGINSQSKPADFMNSLYLPVMEAVIRSPVPVIAALSGAVVGAGMSVALAADLRVASVNSWFRPGFTSVGLVPDCGMSYLLPRIIGRGRALSTLLFDEEIGSTRALEIGLVHAVVPDSSLERDTKAVARQLASSALALRLTRRLFGESIWEDFRAAFEQEVAYQTEALASRDAGEGIKAFLERRAPSFQGK